jgi:hypothetical protein
VLASFEKERARIDDMLNRPASRTAITTPVAQVSRREASRR